MPVCAGMQTNGPPGIHQGLSKGSCNCCHALSARVVHQPTSPVPPFLLVQNLYSKRIAPTDNMWTKSDVAKTCNWLLKGLTALLL